MAYTAEQTFLIGSFPKHESFHSLRHCCQYLNQYELLLNQISTMYNLSTYISNKYHISHMNLPTYNIRATAQWGKIETGAGSGIM